MAVEKAQAQDPAQQPQFTIEKIYVKDLSLEVPNAPQVFLERESPKVDIQLGTRATPLEEGHYEVVLTVTSTAKLGEKTVFLIEAHQAGIFEIRNLPPEQMSPIMGIACPQIVYPYLRGNVADIVTRAGFPPVHLAEINFQAMYDQQQAELQKPAEEPSRIITTA